MKKDGGCRGKTTVHYKNSNIFRLTIVAVFLVLASSILIVSTVSDSDNSDAATGGGCGDGLTWNYATGGPLMISKTNVGTGVMNNYTASSKAPWSGLTFKNVVIGEGVTSIGNYAFSGCTSLASVSISDTVTHIGEKAFMNCTKLTSATIPNSVTSMGIDVFYHCSGLTSVTIGSGLTKLSIGTFNGCTKLNSITIPDNIKSIERHVFFGCKSLTSVFIPNSVTSIGINAFMNCTSLATVHLPDSLIAIGEHTFRNCTKLNNVVIPNNVTSIGTWSFKDCKSMTMIVMGPSVTTISSQAFTGCSNLYNLDLIGTPSKHNALLSKGLFKGNTIPGTSVAIKDLTIHEYTDLKGLNYVNGKPSLTFANNVSNDKVFDSSGSAATKNIRNDTTLGGSVYKYSGSKWVEDTSRVTCTVVFDANGGYCIDSKEAPSGYGVFILPIPTKVGYVFDKWYLNENLTGASFGGESRVVVNNHTFYAKYIERTYTISYDGNGGTGNVPSDKISYSDLSTKGYNLKSSNAFSPPAGKTFVGWVIGFSTVYDANAKISNKDIDGNVTVYALWSTNMDVILSADVDHNDFYAIKYVPASGTATATYGGVLTNVQNATCKGGEYSLDGYYLDTGHTKKIVNSDGTFVPNVLGYTDVSGKWIRNTGATFYAKWNPNEYTLTLDANGGNANVEVKVAHGKDIPSISKISRTGYTLEGYYLEAAGTTKVLNADGTFTGTSVTACIDASGKWVGTSNVTLYAKWSGIEYVVTLNANYTNGVDTTATVKCGDTALTITAHVKRTGFALMGYYADAAGTTKVLNTDGTLVSGVSGYTDATGKWNKAEATVLYAKWADTSITHTVTLKANYDGGADTTATVKYGDTAFRTFTGVSRSGQTLEGYYLEAACTTRVLDANGIFIPGVSEYIDNDGKWIGADNVTFYAKWESFLYTVTLKANYEGGVDTTGTKVAYGDTAFREFEAVLYPGHTLKGYYLDAEGKQQVLDADGIFSSGVTGYIDSAGKWVRTSDTILYAVWY